MKAVFFISLIVLSLNIKAESVFQTDSVKINSIKQVAEDLKKGNIKFLIQGGIAPKYFKGQNLFEEKYKLKYSDLGCIVPQNLKIDIYNKYVAQFLDKKYGAKWRKEVRKDIKGI